MTNLYSSEDVAKNLQEFKNTQCAHTHLQKAFEECLVAAGREGAGKIVMLVGTTGVGKTTLARKLYKALRDLHAADIAADKSEIPVVGFSAVPQSGSSYGWKDFYIRLLTQAQDPTVNGRLLASAQGELFIDEMASSPADRMLTDTLRRCAEKTLKRRKTRWLIIDEAHHLLLQTGMKQQIQFEAIKSFAIEAGITIILIGTHKLLDIRDHSAQLIRRTDMIHFERYDPRDTQHRKEFYSVLRYFEQRIYLRRPTKLADGKDDGLLMIKSIGCVGILRDWLFKSYAEALNGGRDSLDLQFALSCAPPNKALETITREALNGEEKLRDSDPQTLKSLLLEGAIRSSGEAATSRASDQRKKVGRPSPKRYPVGGDINAT